MGFHIEPGERTAQADTTVIAKLFPHHSLDLVTSPNVEAFEISLAVLETSSTSRVSGLKSNPLSDSHSRASHHVYYIMSLVQ